jgi:murein DD-endopeptidase MepM/ murein hydrolase activator NlpD
VRGDGSRVVRLSLPRWLARAATWAATGVAVATVGLSAEYALRGDERAEILSLQGRLAAQRDLVDSFRTRIAAVRGQISGWKAVHARMFHAFGPDTRGVGGGTPLPDPAPAQAPRLDDEIALLSRSVAEESPRLDDLERVVGRAGKLLDTLPLRWPLRGEVHSGFGPRISPWNGEREQHNGLDIGGLPGTPVTAPAPGRVIVAGAGGDFGRHVLIDHGNGVRSRYGHLKKIEVKAGDHVEKGQRIGLVGSTGRSTGPHLHYEILVAGKAVDPRAFLWEPATKQ